MMQLIAFDYSPELNVEPTTLEAINKVLNKIHFIGQLEGVILCGNSLELQAWLKSDNNFLGSVYKVMSDNEKVFLGTFDAKVSR